MRYITTLFFLLLTFQSFAQDYVFIPMAMQREAAPLIASMDNADTLNISGFSIYRGQIDGRNVIAGVSGPGLINMSSMMSLVCSRYRVSTVINYGMVGGYGRNVHKLDLIIGTECMNTGSYMSSRKRTGINIRKWDFVTFTDGGNDELRLYKSDSALMAVAQDIKYPHTLHTGRVGSADIWCNERKMIRMMMRRYSIACEDMEAVAVYQVAGRFGIPCITIKGVSDNCFLNEEYDDTVIAPMTEFVMELIKGI